MTQDSSLKYSNIYHQTYGRHVVRPEVLLGNHQGGNSNTLKSYETTKRKRFFRHPRIEIDKRLDRTPITIRADGIMKSDGTRPNAEEFKANIWSFKINNKNYFSTPADACSAQIYLTNVGQYLNFKWRSNIQIPEECRISDISDESPRQRYTKLLAYYYLVERLSDTNSPTVDIQKDESYLLNFLFTFEDSNYAYFISPIEWATWYSENEVFYSRVGGTYLFTRIDTKNFPIIIKFQWRKPGSIDQYEYSSISGEKYLINVNDWNDITMSRG